MSGGQRQRVALARALVIRPAVLLLDEPLSNLDLKLREEMRVEIAELQRRLGITTVFVTHDQGEALVMSDRIAVMNAGRIEQIGRPAEIYERPATRFVAEFIGRMNLFPAGLRGRRQRVRAHGTRLELALPGAARRIASGAAVHIAVRPERARVSFERRRGTASPRKAGSAGALPRRHARDPPRSRRRCARDRRGAQRWRRRRTSSRATRFGSPPHSRRASCSFRNTP